LDSHLQEQITKEQKNWGHVLECVIAVVCVLAEYGLAFRGDNEKLGLPHNGTFLT
jgi:hypothetical protein